MIAHCLFEQSGTFKREFEKLGIKAIDYDICNDYGQTDRQIDLFAEIERGGRGEPSIFDEIAKDDLILAFFPCTRFEDQILLSFRGDLYQMANLSLEEKLKNDIRLHDELNLNYKTISTLVLIALNRGQSLIIENPISEQHYLRRYWAVKPRLIDHDRRENGDYYKKPTQYFFINREPKQNLVFEPLDYVETRKQRYITGKDGKSRQVVRSEISPQYASRFIRQYLIDEREEKAWQN